jgi:hypothetical protein
VHAAVGDFRNRFGHQPAVDEPADGIVSGHPQRAGSIGVHRPALEQGIGPLAPSDELVERVSGGDPDAAVRSDAGGAHTVVIESVEGTSRSQRVHRQTQQAAPQANPHVVVAVLEERARRTAEPLLEGHRFQDG